jgi:hypothetical protein
MTVEITILFIINFSHETLRAIWELKSKEMMEGMQAYRRSKPL